MSARLLRPAVDSSGPAAKSTAGLPHHARMKPRKWEPGDFAVVHSRGFVGNEIARMQRWSRVTDPHRTGWVHAITGLPDGMIIEAEPGGAVIRPYHYDDYDVCWSTGRVEPPRTASRDRMIEAAHRYEGTGYSYLTYGAIAAHQWHVPVPGLRRFIAWTGEQICSELSDQIAHDGDWFLFAGRWAGYVRPYDLAMLIGAPARF